jgi:O-antigen ligase
METSFSLLALPIILNKLTFTQAIFHRIFLSFISGLLVTCVICLSNSGFEFIQYGDSSAFFFEQLTKSINIQPTYMAYYLCLAVTVCLYYLYYEPDKISIPFLIGVLVFYFVVLMLTEGRTAYVSMVFIFSFFILKYLFEEVRIKPKRMAFAISIIFIMSMLLINHYNFNTSSETVSGDYWERLALWKSAINANVNYIFGVGTGDYKDVLNRYYSAQGMDEYAKGSYNSHNQFIQLFFSNGILGLIALMVMIARPLYLSFKIQNSLGILIVFPFVLYGMTEVFLGRYQGVVFFAFCHQIVILQYYLTRPELTFRAT